MNKREWLKFIAHSTEAHHIREYFNACYGLLDEIKVQKLFFDRIDYLLEVKKCKHTQKSLKDLREDIEDEIETGRLRHGLGKIVIEKKREGIAPSQASYNRIDIWQRRIDLMNQEINKLTQRIEKEKAKYVEA